MKSTLSYPQNHKIFLTVFTALLVVSISDAVIVDALILPSLEKAGIIVPLSPFPWQAGFDELTQDPWWRIFVLYYWPAFTVSVITIYSIISLKFKTWRPLLAMLILFTFGAEDLLYYLVQLRLPAPELPWLDILPSWKAVMWLSGETHTRDWMIWLGGVFSIVVAYLVCVPKFSRNTKDLDCEKAIESMNLPCGVGSNQKVGNFISTITPVSTR